MACNISLGRLEPCKDSVGGLNAIYFINYGTSGLGVEYDDTDTDVIDLIGSSVSAYKYELKSSASTLSQPPTTSRDNGTTFITQTLAITLKKLDVDMHKEFMLLAYGRPHIVVEDNNGNLFYCGLEYGMELTGGDVVTGGAKGDLSGYTMTFTGEEKKLANFLVPASGTTIAQKLAGLGLVVTEGT